MLWMENTELDILYWKVEIIKRFLSTWNSFKKAEELMDLVLPGIQLTKLARLAEPS